jgi:hypothetical protein
MQGIDILRLEVQYLVIDVLCSPQITCLLMLESFLKRLVYVHGSIILYFLCANFRPLEGFMAQDECAVAVT